MISKYFDIQAELASEIAVLRNPIPGLKKRRFDFYTSSADLFLNTRLDRSSREKNSPNSAGTGLLVHWRNRVGNTTENGRQNRPPVTTTHLLLQDPHGKTVALLPISQPNSDFLSSKCNRRAEGGGGGQPDASRRISLIHKLAQKIYYKWAPAPLCCSKKSTSAGSRSSMSIELTSAVWKHSRQKSGGLLVLLALADYANADGIAWPAVPTLARKARMSRRNLQRWLSTVERDGELRILRNQGRRGTNIYRICVPTHCKEKGDAHGTDDVCVAKSVTPVSSTNDASVIQSVSESLIESTPIIPKGDDIDFWIRVSFNCFKQPVHPVRPHVLRALSVVVAALNKNQADSLLEFYQTELLDSKEPPYSSRRHSPERLILDLPRQLALAVQTCPPPKKYDFTIEDVREYLLRKYPDCTLPISFDELNSWRVPDSVQSEVRDAMRKRNDSGDSLTDPL